MANYRIAYNHTTKVALVQLAATAIPAGSNAIGTFTHEDVEPAITDLEYDTNHVIFQHVRDALYHTSSGSGLRVDGSLQFPENITDMAGITIQIGSGALSSVKPVYETEGAEG